MGSEHRAVCLICKLVPTTICFQCDHNLCIKNDAELCWEKYHSQALHGWGERAEVGEEAAANAA